ncbi:MAG: CPBP family glutamic-type intramembrane protease [Chloroflexota bacterium]
MNHFKWIAPLGAYAAVVVGLLLAHSAWGALLAFHFAIIVSLWLAKPDISPSLLFKSTHKKWIALSILLCGSSGVGLYFLRSTFGIAEDLSARLASIGLSSATWPLFIAYSTLVNPFIEEYFWRGYLGSPARGLHIFDGIFAGYHVFLLEGKAPASSIVFGFVLLTLAGWFWRQLTRQDQGLLAPVLGHMAADFSILMALYWMSTL